MARSYHASPRRDRNDGDLAPPGVGAVRVGRGERVERSYGRGAVTLDGAARSSNAHPSAHLRQSFLPAPRPRYPQDRKILSLMILCSFLGGLCRYYVRAAAALYGLVVLPAGVSRGRRRREGGMLL